MDNQEFDDFKLAEPQMATNIKSKDLTELEAFKDDFDSRLEMTDSSEDLLTEIAIGYVQAAGDVNEVYQCTYRATNGVGLNGWGFSSDGSNTNIDLFLTVYRNPEKSHNISSGDLDRYFNWIQRFYDQSLSGSIFSKIEDVSDIAVGVQDTASDLNQIAMLINKTKHIDCIRLFILTNAIMPVDYEKPVIELENGTNCEYYVWDIKRIMQQDSIMSGRTPIVVNFEEDYNCSLPCIKMPEVSENVTCYLSIIPGLILAQVYNKYHHQLLEMNVRTFLQFKGASNKGIRDTLIGHVATAKEKLKGITDSDPEPDMFFAYNNGISTTASDVKMNENGRITSIKSWQIVNGGQTTAAISAVTKMKGVDIKSLAQVYVPMKVSVVKDTDKVQDIVPKISKFANTQSAIKKSDFDINATFLADIEQQSREEWVMNANHPVSKWFFERTRGQYLDKAKRNTSAKAERDFYLEYPQEQMFDKTTLSKFMMAWDQNPSLVCKGGENNYGEFHTKMVKNRVRFDQTKYHRTIAKAILFRAIDAFYGKAGIDLPGYKSNMVAYTMAVISFMSNKSLNLDAIWNEQYVMSPHVYNELTISIYSVYAQLATGSEFITYKVKIPTQTSTGKIRNKYEPRQIESHEIEKLKKTSLYKVLQYVKQVHPYIYKHVINIPEGENINEWTKKTLCWDALKTTMEQNQSEFIFPKDLLSSNGDVDEEITEGQQKVIDEVAQYTSDMWYSINKWSKANPGKLTPKDQAFAGQVGYRVSRGWGLSYKQSRWALDVKDKAEEAGWKE